MLKTVKAIYQQGELHLLESVDLKEGQEVDVTIESITSDYTPNLQRITTVPIPKDEMQKIYQWLDGRTAGIKPLSSIIIEERGE